MDSPMVLSYKVFICGRTWWKRPARLTWIKFATCSSPASISFAGLAA